jgi:hypothetical protein
MLRPKWSTKKKVLDNGREHFDRSKRTYAGLTALRIVAKVAHFVESSHFSSSAQRGTPTEQAHLPRKGGVNPEGARELVREHSSRPALPRRAQPTRQRALKPEAIAVTRQAHRVFEAPGARAPYAHVFVCP